MADDTPTSEAAKEALLTAAAKAAVKNTWLTSNGYLAAVDALIAAVRAETLADMVEAQGWKHVYAALQRLAEAPPG